MEGGDSVNAHGGTGSAWAGTAVKPAITAADNSTNLAPAMWGS
ncbi:hypothetical protein XA26_50000 [Mycolicibacterium fortuitum]|uniref:Uncharacterized protein n=1 Tax=Mycolicibacterium fortuitum TaxID=1766 RepID=A0A0N9XXC7_MYCFO|nr:hypothetical protein XA26_50000 [Mycolicibacterium fortuitum]